MRPLGSPAQLEARRLKAWKLLNEGVAPVDVARRLGIDRRSVRRWRAQAEREGRDSLAARRVAPAGRFRFGAASLV